MTERENETNRAEVPVEDALEQRTEVTEAESDPEAPQTPATPDERSDEADPADRAEQSLVVETDDDEYR